MNSVPMSPANPADDELERAREVLERTMRYLAKCAEDPVSGPRSDDPKALMHDLKGLALERPTEDADSSEPRTIPLRHRRSA